MIYAVSISTVLRVRVFHWMRYEIPIIDFINIDTESAEELCSFVVGCLEESKVWRIEKINIEKSTIADFMIVSSGLSSRHIKASAEKLVETLKVRNVFPLGVEIDANASWALVDFGNIIVHIMSENTRQLYDIETLWNTDMVNVSS